MSETNKIREHVRHLIEYYTEKNAEDLKILDVGCGDDKLFKFCYGVDRVEREGVIIDDAIQLNTIVDGSLDILYASHVLEDMRYPIDVLNKWISKLKVNGLLILYMPHGDWYPKAGSKLANKAHKQDWWPMTLIKMMETVNLGDYDMTLVFQEDGRPPGYSYDYDRRGVIEYSFLQIWRRNA